VLALVGAGVFLSGAGLALLSRTSLVSLDREMLHDHERLAASLAREVSRAVGHDLRLLSVAAAAPAGTLPGALGDVRRFGQIAAAAFVMDASGTLTACEPVFECSTLGQYLPATAATEAMASQRPLVTGGVRTSDGSSRLFAFIPFRSSAGQSVAVAGLTIDPAGRYFLELLDPSDIAATLRVRLLDQTGRPMTAAEDGPPAVTTTTSAAVAGTPWIVQLSDTGPDPRTPIAAFQRRSLALAPTLAAVAMLLGWGIARSVRQPLLTLTRAAERIARGDLDQQIDLRRAAAGGDEISRVAIALERMRTSLKASIGEIERTNRELEGRVAARTQELEGANTRLQERERIRQQLLRKVISAQEDERKRVARELHDDTSQTLAALGIGIDLAIADAEATASGPMRQRLLDLRSLVQGMHQELHRMIVNLRPSMLDDLGLAAAIRWFAERQLARAGIFVRCEIADFEPRLPPELETAVFRAVQEALVNISRHASADSVLIQGSLENGVLSIEIEDDGVGFDEAVVVRSPDSLRGVGLLGMRERIEIFGGTVTIDAAPGEGTRLELAVPVP
jgi:signal transduction histidine kinase